MNKTELIAAVAEQAELSKKDAEKALKAFTDVIAAELVKGEKVQLVGFGTFEVSEREAREGRNPLTGEKITSPTFTSALALATLSFNMTRPLSHASFATVLRLMIRDTFRYLSNLIKSLLLIQNPLHDANVHGGDYRIFL